MTARWVQWVWKAISGSMRVSQLRGMSEGGESLQVPRGGVPIPRESMKKSSKSEKHRRDSTHILLHSQPPRYSTIFTKPFQQSSTKLHRTPESSDRMLSNLAQILAIQCPFPGQPGARLFNRKDISVFLRNWERFAGKCCYGRLLTSRITVIRVLLLMLRP